MRVPELHPFFPVAAPSRCPALCFARSMTTTLYIAHRYGDANAHVTQFVDLALASRQEA